MISQHELSDAQSDEAAKKKIAARLPDRRRTAWEDAGMPIETYKPHESKALPLGGREIELLHSRGVARIFSPEDGQHLGLPGMINIMVRECDVDLAATPPASPESLFTGDHATLARMLTLAETGRLPAAIAFAP